MCSGGYALCALSTLDPASPTSTRSARLVYRLRLSILAISHNCKTPESETLSGVQLWRWRHRSQVKCLSSQTFSRDPGSLFCFGKQNMLRLSILDTSQAVGLFNLHSIKNARLWRAIFYTSGDGENRTRVQKMFKKESTRAYPVLFPRRVLETTSIKQATPCRFDPLCFEIVSRRYDLYSEMYITCFPYRTSEKTNAA